MRSLDGVLSDRDGLKWFNGLYLEVTSAVQSGVTYRRWNNSAWLELLDVQFAQLYFDALRSWVSQETGTPQCWSTLFERRTDNAVARVQFALAGVNAHINHDLAQALVKTGMLMSMPPVHGSPAYEDYTDLNSVIESVVGRAKHDLMVRLPGNALPPVNHLEDLLAAWSVSAAREAAYTNAEVLWTLKGSDELESRYLSFLDGVTTLSSKALLTPVPIVLGAGASR